MTCNFTSLRHPVVLYTMTIQMTLENFFLFHKSARKCPKSTSLSELGGTWQMTLENFFMFHKSAFVEQEEILKSHLSRPPKFWKGGAVRTFPRAFARNFFLFHKSAFVISSRFRGNVLIAPPFQSLGGREDSGRASQRSNVNRKSNTSQMNTYFYFSKAP